MQQSAPIAHTAVASTAWSPEALQELSQHFKSRSPEEILHWGIAAFSPAITLATSFGPQSIVLMHLLAQIHPETTVFYLDTDLLFPETYALRDDLAARLGLRFTCVRSRLSLEEQAAAHGAALWWRNPDVCCHVRKVEPLRHFLASQRAWITGIRREHTSTRANAGVIEWDATNGLVKLNPLANWHTEQVWAYIRAHDLPFNPLHTQGYPSIGCWPCTKPVRSGDNPRAGRWANWNKTECGIHL
jgi:phosphoadenosine phosphosulfate reductase